MLLTAAVPVVAACGQTKSTGNSTQFDDPAGNGGDGGRGLGGTGAHGEHGAGTGGGDEACLGGMAAAVA